MPDTATTRTSARKRYRFREYHVTTVVDPITLPAFEAVCVTGEDRDCGATSGEVHTEGELTHWIAEHCVRAPGDVSGLPRGSQMLTDAMEAWRGAGRQVNGVRGVWNEGDLDSNLQSLNAAVQMGLTPQQAVWHTFTGKFARRSGFTRATI